MTETNPERDAREDAIERMIEVVAYKRTLRPDDTWSLRAEMERALDALLEPRDSECETCFGDGLGTVSSGNCWPGWKLGGKCPSCSGSGRSLRPSIVILRDDLEPVGRVHLVDGHEPFFYHDASDFNAEDLACTQPVYTLQEDQT